MIPAARTRSGSQKARAHVLRAAYFFFLVIAVFALSYAGYMVASAHAYQAFEESRFENAPPKEVRHPLLIGDVIGEIRVARLGLKAIVTQGVSSQVLGRAVGHIPGSALPGQAGNVALAAHRDSFFRPLRHIRQGDSVMLNTRQGDFLYRVESILVVPPSDVQVLQTSGGHTLTLITCFPFDYVGPAPNRFVVQARQVGASAQTPPH